MDEKVYFIQEQGKLPKELDDFKSYFCKGNKLAFVGKFVSKEDKIVVYSCPKYIDKGTFEKAQNGDETARKTIISHIDTPMADNLIEVLYFLSYCFFISIIN